MYTNEDKRNLPYMQTYTYNLWYFCLLLIKHAYIYTYIYISFQVRWVQQQHEKIRKKRDFQRIKFPEPSSSLRSDPLALLRSIATGSQIKYRSTDSHLIFPDPLFKEQWYLVSYYYGYLFCQFLLFVNW